MFAELLDVRQITERDTVYIFQGSEIARKAKAGQFVEVHVNPGLEPFLRRPISIYDIDGERFSLLVRTVGRGTKEMTCWEKGMRIDILGPLGNGFHRMLSDRKVLLVGGGIGAAPLYELGKQLIKAGTRVEFLFSPKRDARVMDAFQGLGSDMEVYFSENRTELPVLLAQLLSGGHRPDRVYACGPNAMMHTVVKKCEEAGIPIEVSMEAIMGCGMGICSGCVIKIKDGDDFSYKKVCQDGPVFDGKEVIFDV